MDDIELGPDLYYADAEMIDAEEFEWGARKTLVNDSLMPGAEQTVALVWVMPGREDPLHAHSSSEQVAHVLAGECEFQVGDSLYHLVPGDTLRVPRGVVHSATCTSWEPLRMIVTQTAARVATEFVKDETV
jgi:quercetin dioxygenase-like cupin family protein